MADDGLYSIYSKLDEIYEILERNISSGRGNYSAPYNDTFVKEILDNIKNVMKKDRKTGEYVDTGKIDFKAITTAINNYLKLLDLSTSKSNVYVKSVMERVAKNYEKLAADSQAQQAYLARALKDLEKELVRLSSGEYSKTPMLNMKKAQNNPEAQEFLKGVRAELAALISMDSRVSKLAYLFETDVAGRKGRVRRFTEDLIEGLGRSKFVGGALSDMFRLLTYFAATYVKNIPLIGKPLAAILVALGSLGPSLVNGIISGITQALSMILFSRLGGKAGSAIFDKLFGGIGKFFSGGAIAKLFSGIFGGRVSGKAASTVGTLVMDGKTLYTSTESLRKAGVATSSASKAGVGAGIARVLGAFGKITPWFGRIFGVVSKFLGPVGWILTGIQLAVLLFKNWDKVMGTIKNGWNTITSGSFWSNIWEGIKNWWNTGNPNEAPDPGTPKTFRQAHPYLSLIPGVGLAGDIANATNMLLNRNKETKKSFPIGVVNPVLTSTYGQLRLDQGGVPMNLGNLTATTASREMEDYRKSNKALFDAYYEIVPQGYANVQGSFTNDLKMRDIDNKNRMGAVLYRGATEDLATARKALIEAGMSPERAAMLMYTSGIATGTSKHSKTGGHSNPLGYGFDLSTGKQWTKKDWDLALPIIQQIWKQRGIDVFYEDERGHKFVSPTAENARFAHLHAQTAKEYMYGGKHKDIRSGIWYAYTKRMGEVEQALLDQKKEVLGEAKSNQQSIGVTPASEMVQPEVEVKSEEDDRFNQSGYTRIVQPDDSNIKSTIPVTKKSKVPQIDYTGDEMFSEVLRRTIDAAMRDPVQQ